MTSDQDLPHYLRGLIDYNRKDSRIVLGLHSGTSADGPTALIARFFRLRPKHGIRNHRLGRL